VEVKLKSLSKDNEQVLTGHPLLATASAAFFKTTLLADVGKDLKTTLCPERNNVVDLVVNIKESNLTSSDVANFTDALQKALDETKLF
jgi:hypothetical protein